MTRPGGMRGSDSIARTIAMTLTITMTQTINNNTNNDNININDNNIRQGQWPEGA